MKYRWDKKYLYWGVTVFLTVCACLIVFVSVTNFQLVAGFFRGITDTFMPVIYGFAFAYVLSPVMNFFEKKCFRPLYKKIFRKAEEYKLKKAARVSGAVSAIILALALIAGVVALVLPQLLTTLQSITSNMNSYLRSAQKWADSALAGLPEVQDYVSDFLKNITVYMNDWLKTTVLPQMSGIVASLSSGIISTLSALLNVIIGLIICVYLLYGKDLFAAQIKKVMFGMLSPANANGCLKAMRDVNKKFGGFIVGKLLDCLVVGVMFFAAMSIFQLPYVVLISVLMAVSNIIPYFGPFIGMVPSALLIFLVDPIQALYFIIIGLVLMQVDGNIIEPKILGDNTGLSSFWVIFALLAGQYFFGIIGLIIGVPLFSVLYTAVKAYVNRRLAARGLPGDSNTYREIAFISEDGSGFVPLSELRLQERLQSEQEAAARKKDPKSESVKAFFARMRKKKKNK